ncbi:MAG: hypothetical protein ACKOEH_02715 [Actinomycetota bacterium]
MRAKQRVSPRIKVVMSLDIQGPETCNDSIFNTYHDLSRAAPNVHPAEFIYLSDLERARKSG